MSSFDLVQAFDVAAYNAVVEPLYALPDFGRARCRGVLYGNTGGLWPVFAAEIARGASANPIDEWARAEVGRLYAASPVAWEARFSYERPPRRVAMQQLARVSGLASLSPTHLSVHPVYGPWIAFRAAVVEDADFEGESSGPALEPCASCKAPCMEPYQQALAMSEGRLPVRADVVAGWRAWLAVRDACPVGRDQRYPDAQIRYHYGVR